MSDPPSSASSREVRHLSDLQPQQVHSGVAAWLGCLFGGLDMYVSTLVRHGLRGPAAEIMGRNNEPWTTA